LQQRLNRKAVTPKLLGEFPAHLRAYDLLADGDEDLRGQPFAERRARLEKFIATSNDPRIDLSPLIRFKSWEELTAARGSPASAGAGADADAVEGVMIKQRDAPYTPGRPKGLWWKWKRDPMIIDAVLMYAQRGHGKRSSYYSDYTFGVWTKGETGEELVPVGKAYFGFTDEELIQIDRFVRRNTIDRFGPVREVAHEPKLGLVMEVAFECAFRASIDYAGTSRQEKRTGWKPWRSCCSGESMLQWPPTEDVMADNQVARWAGGSPLGVLARLVLVSILVGVILSALGLDPFDIIHSIERLIRSIWNMGFDAIRWLWRYFLLGAVIVIPIWILMRLLNAPRGK
jgi:hypothetical protein